MPCTSFPASFPQVDRRRWIARQCQDQVVLHVGCMAHPHTADHKRRGKLLHDQLAEVAKDLTGVDVDVETNRDLLPIDSNAHRILCADVCDPLAFHAACSVSPVSDVIVLADILEHLSLPGRALDVVRTFAPEATILVSVPNAFGVAANAKRERVNPDHVAWYSPRTLTALLERHGYCIDQLVGCRGRGLRAKVIIAKASPCPSPD